VVVGTGVAVTVGAGGGVGVDDEPTVHVVGLSFGSALVSVTVEPDVDHVPIC
jgi:hypothetical protein